MTELHHERQATQTQLDALDTQPDPTGTAELIDTIPLLAGTVDLHPDRIQAALYQAFDIQAVYSTELHQVSIYATITSSTPAPSPLCWPTPYTTPPQPPASPARPRQQLRLAPQPFPLWQNALSHA